MGRSGTGTVGPGAGFPGAAHARLGGRRRQAKATRTSQQGSLDQSVFELESRVRLGHADQVARVLVALPLTLFLLGEAGGAVLLEERGDAFLHRGRRAMGEDLFGAWQGREKLGHFIDGVDRGRVRSEDGSQRRLERPGDG